MNILLELRKLALPESQFIVVGSGTLAMLGIIPETADIDLAVSPELYASLKKAGWEEFDEGQGKMVLRRDTFDVGIGYGSWTLQALLADALFMDGVAFISLDKLLQWKKASGRDKDLAHIQLIESYLERL